jgi:hypothetical protein
MGKRNRVQDVVGFRFGARSILVDQHDPPPHPAHDQRVGGRRADKTTSHYTCFHVVS